MRYSGVLATGVVVLGLLGGCSKPQKLTPEEAALATQATAQVMGSSSGAIEGSRYRVYRWMTSQEMVDRRLGYDPSMAESTRLEIEQAVDDDLADKGFREGDPADFLLAFSDTYLNRNRSAPGGAFEGPGVEVTEGVSGSQVVAYNDMEVYRSPEETFAIVFLDAQTGRLLYRAVGKEILSGAQSADKIEATIYRALDGMPVPLPAAPAR